MLRAVSMPRKLPDLLPNRDNKSKNEAYLNPRNNQDADKSTAFQGFESLKRERYNQIYAHELAHKNAGGSQAGSITIETDGNGIAFAGHVPIKLPAINKSEPEKAYREAQIAYSSALAPSDPSGQDLAVAAMAQSIMGQVNMTNKSTNTQPNRTSTDPISNDVNSQRKLNFFA